MINLGKEELDTLLNAKDEELFSIIGLYSIPITETPFNALQIGRAGDFWQNGPEILGDNNIFWHKKYEKIGRKFYDSWKDEIYSVICKDEKVYAEIKSKGFRELDTVVASLVGYLSASVPQLAPFTGVLVLIAVIITRTGISAFCETFS